MKKYLLNLIFLIFTMSSCVSMKTKGVSTSADYNQRIKLSNPHFQKKLTIVGGATVALTTIIGGATMAILKPNIIKKTDSEGEIENVPAADIAVGAGLGLGIGLTSNFLAGKGKIFKINNTDLLNKFIKKFEGGNYIVLDKINTNDIVTELKLIDKRVESKFVVNGIDDCYDFVNAFPKSKHLDKVVEQAKFKLSRQNIEKLILLIPTYPNLQILVEQYLVLSKTTIECIEAGNKFPSISKQAFQKGLNNAISTDDAILVANNSTDLYSEAEIKAAINAKTFNDAVNYFKTFKQGIMSNSVFNRFYPDASKSQLETLINFYPNADEIEQAKRNYIEYSKSISEFYKALQKYPIFKIKPIESNYFETISGTQKAISIINDYKPWVSENLANRMISECKYEALDYILKSTNENSIASMKECIEKINIDFLMPEALNYISKMNTKITVIENELDDVNKYVKVVKSTHSVTKGDGLTFWESLLSVETDIKKYNVLVGGRVKNFGSKTKKIAIKTIYKTRTVSKSNILYFIPWSESDDISKHDEYYYLELLPGEEKVFLTMYNLKETLYQLNLVLYNSYTMVTLANDPYDIELSYCNSNISDEILKKQTNLINEVVENNGKLKTSEGWPSLYEPPAVREQRKQDEMKLNCTYTIENKMKNGEIVYHNKYPTPIQIVKCANSKTAEFYFWEKSMGDANIFSASEGYCFYYNTEAIAAYSKERIAEITCGCDK